MHEVRAMGALLLRKFGSLSIREILVVTAEYAFRPYILGGGGGRDSGVSRSGDGVCYIFLAGNHVMHLCNLRFSKDGK